MKDRPVPGAFQSIFEIQPIGDQRLRRACLAAIALFRAWERAFSTH